MIRPMLSAFTLSIAQLGDRAILGVLAKSIVTTLALLATLGIALWYGVVALARMVGATEALSGIAGVLALLAGLTLGWLIFRAITVAVIGVFVDDVVAAVEARHYPAALASARPVPFGRSVAMGAGSMTRTIGFNLLAAPFYVALIVTGVGPAIGFFAVNALLLGRDLFDMVAARHMTRQALPAARARTRLPRLALGAAGTALLLIPFVNLIAPVVSAAMATHLFHRKLRA